MARWARPHFHPDHLGSTVAKTNETGARVEQIRSLAYGALRGHYTDSGGAILPTSADRKEWTGYDSDAADYSSNGLDGLDYAGARYYDPTIGQFLSHDPQRQFASPYAYGPGDPMNGTDPNGESFLGSIGHALIKAFEFVAKNSNLSLSFSYTISFGSAPGPVASRRLAETANTRPNGLSLWVRESDRI